MGCWYSTCFMSNLPIMHGDDITIFVLAPNYPDEYDGMTCYPTERYVPIGFPIFAEYDDDVQVRNVREVNEHTSRYLHEFATVYTKKGSVLLKDGDNDIEVPAFVEHEWTDLEQFLQDIIHGQIYVDDRNGKKRRLEHVMVHTDLYYKLLKNMAERVPYGQTETLEQLMYGKIIKTIEWLKEEDELQTLMKIKYGIDAPCLKRFSDKIHIDSLTRWNSLDKIVQYYIETEDGYILDDILHYLIWSFVMNYSRKGYHCYSGGGSQSQEMMLQKVIAEFIMVKCTEREMEAKAEVEESEEEIEGNVLEETVYWWGD